MRGQTGLYGEMWIIFWVFGRVIEAGFEDGGVIFSNGVVGFGIGFGVSLWGVVRGFWGFGVWDFGFFSLEGVRPLLEPFLNWGWSETEDRESAGTSYLGGVSSRRCLWYGVFIFGQVCSVKDGLGVCWTNKISESCSDSFASILAIMFDVVSVK
jgi:hypothetical protein